MFLPMTLNWTVRRGISVGGVVPARGAGSLFPYLAMTPATSSDCSATISCQSGLIASAYQSESLEARRVGGILCDAYSFDLCHSAIPSYLDRVAEARRAICADLGLVELGRVPLDGDRALAAADRQDAVALLQRLPRTARSPRSSPSASRTGIPWRCRPRSAPLRRCRRRRRATGRRKVRDLLAAHLSGRGVDRGEDLRVLAAAADVARRALRRSAPSSASGSRRAAGPST